MKSMLRTVNDHGKVYEALVFCCPGCIAGRPEGYDGIHMLPVNAPHIEKAWWEWDFNLEAPTLSPSILTQGVVRCHSFLKAGVFEFLSDCEHSLANQKVPMPDLPEWVTRLQ